jgi:hypothetical protein
MQTDTLKLDASLLSSVYGLGKDKTLVGGQQLPPAVKREKTEKQDPVGKAPCEGTYEAANRQSATTKHHHRSYAPIPIRLCGIHPVRKRE